MEGWVESGGGVRPEVTRSRRSRGPVRDFRKPPSIPARHPGKAESQEGDVRRVCTPSRQRRAPPASIQVSGAPAGVGGVGGLLAGNASPHTH